jgi:hypothetical protein
MTLMMGGDSSVSAFPDGDNLFHWKGTLNGGSGTVSLLTLLNKSAFDISSVRSLVCLGLAFLCLGSAELRILFS